MKSFYEVDREATQLFVTHANDRFNFHYHINLEIYLIKSGSYLLTVNDSSFVASAGSIVVVDSYAVHGYERLDLDDKDGCKIVIIPYDYLTKFNSVRGDRIIKNPHVIDKELCNKLIGFVEAHIQTATSQSVRESAINYFLSLIVEIIEFKEEKLSGSVALIKNVLSYIHKNFQSDISRKKIAKEFGYSEEHVSRVFAKFMKTSISGYVNDLRLDYVENNKKTTQKPLTELIFEAGFNSQRTYYRVKSKND